MNLIEMIEKYNISIGDDVIISGQIVDITVCGNPVIKTRSGIKILIKPEDIKTIRPQVIRPTEDKRKGD